MNNLLINIIFLSLLIFFPSSCDKKSEMEAGKREEEILNQFTVENNKNIIITL